jgi:hypothetical protein
VANTAEADRGDIPKANYHAKIIDVPCGKPRSTGICAEFPDFVILSPGPLCAADQQQDRRKHNAE